MKQFVYFLSISLLVASNGKTQANKKISLDKFISSLYAKHWLNGAIVAGQNGKIIFSKGFGYADFADSVLFTPFTPSDGGSNAKTFTAAAIVLLSEAGKLKLNDTVQQYLPFYPYNNTTIFNLITHSTGGLPDYDFYFNHVPDSVILTTQRIVDILRNTNPKLPYRPNENFYYDSPGFDIAAMIVEVVSGKSYQQFLDSVFFRPLKMSNSFVRPARLFNFPKKRTKGYQYKNGTLQLFDIADREGFYGGSNIWFSATDLYRWGTSFYQKPVLSDSVIDTLKSLVSIHRKPSAVRLGAWYGGRNEHAFYYWGDLLGFYSWVYWDSKQKFTIAFVSNTGTPQWVRPQLTSALIDVMEGKPVPNITKPISETIERNQLEKITGTYLVKSYGKVDVYIKDTIPVLRVPSAMEYKMVQVAKDVFYIPGLEPWLSFRTLRAGKFEEMVWSATILQAVGKRLHH